MKAGLFHYSNTQTHEFVESLKAQGIPVGRVTDRVKTRRGKTIERHYSFIVADHVKRARKVLLKDAKLDKYKKSPVTQIAGPRMEAFPTTISANEGPFVKNMDHK